jgi:hypothetical protein
VSIDVTGLVVAVVGIAGTLGATVVTQYATTRDKRLDAANQRDARAEERGESTRAAKQTTYAELNAAARDFRSVGHDYLVDKLAGAETEDLKQLEIAREKYRNVYAHAQMVLPDRALEVASEVNECLGYSYRAVHDIVSGFGRSITIEDLHQWYDKPLSDATRLLRRVLREDLGVAEPGTDIDSVLRRLRKTRLDLWPD